MVRFMGKRILLTDFSGIPQILFLDDGFTPDQAKYNFLYSNYNSYISFLKCRPAIIADLYGQARLFVNRKKHPVGSNFRKVRMALSSISYFCTHVSAEKIFRTAFFKR